MSLAAILYPAPTAKGLEEFFFANYQHHLAVMGALRQTQDVELELFQIYPVQPENMENWLRQHQKQHDFMNAALGIPGTDLTAVDFGNQREFDSWAFQHFLQHQAAGQLSGLPI